MGGAMIEHVSSLSQLQTHLDKSKAANSLVVIDFHATWCGPCHAIAPFYEQMSTKYTSVKFLKVDVDAAQPVAAQYSVSAMPTFVFLKGGKKVQEVRGANRNAIETALKQHAGGSMSNPDGHSWGSGQKLGDGNKESAPVHPQQAVEAFKSLNPQLALLLAMVIVWAYFSFVKS